MGWGILFLDRSIMIREFCAGGLVFSGDRLLILKRFNGVWLFPKGHIEPGETPEIAAIREVQEESGITARIIKKLDSTSYTFSEQGAKHLKKVYWFLMAAESDQITLEKDFFSDGLWITKERLDSLSFLADRELAKTAFSFISHWKGNEQ
jgi:diadenosine hexaphosphate hydrolase (ATP-forming)